jgi:hypothetical protein
VNVPVLISANSLQNFSADPEENLAAEEKNSASQYRNFSFLKEFGLKKNTIFICVSGKITKFFLDASQEIERIREGNQFC